MKPYLPILLSVPLSFAAGWILKPGPGSAETGTPDTVRVSSAAGPSAGTDTSDDGKKKPPLFAPPAPLEIKPLTSLTEILDIIGDPASFDDEETMVIAMMELLPRLMLTDAATVQRMVEQLQETEIPGDGKKGIGLGLMLRWMTVDPAAAVGYSLAHPGLTPEDDQMNMLGLVYLAKSRPEAAKALTNLMPEDNRKEVDTFLLKLNASSDPAGTLTNPESLAALDNGDIAKLAGKWARKDPAAAQAWLEGLPADQRADGRIAARMAETRYAEDPQGTIAWVSGLPDGPEKEQARDQLIRMAAGNSGGQAQTDAQIAVLPAAWQPAARLRSIIESPTRDAAAGAARLTGLLAADPSLAQDGNLKRAAQQVADAYATSKEFTAGSQWASTLPPGPAQISAIKEISQNWSKADPAAASGWITTLPEGEGRNVAAMTLIGRISEEDPQSALVWAQSISDEKMRAEGTSRVFQDWFRTNPVEAAAAVQNLSPEMQQQLSAGEK